MNLGRQYPPLTNSTNFVTKTDIVRFDNTQWEEGEATNAIFFRCVDHFPQYNIMICTSATIFSLAHPRGYSVLSPTFD